MSDPLIPERWQDTYASCCQFKPHKCGQCYLMMQLGAAEAKVAEQALTIAELTDALDGMIELINFG